MYCLCVNVYCHRVTAQLQLTNNIISYHVIYLYRTSGGTRICFRNTNGNFSAQQVWVLKCTSVAGPSLSARDSACASKAGLCIVILRAAGYWRPKCFNTVENIYERTNVMQLGSTFICNCIIHNMT